MGHRDGVLSAQEAREMIEQVQADMLTAKAKMDEERRRQEEALQKKLSERKKAKIGEMVRPLYSSFSCL